MAKKNISNKAKKQNIENKVGAVVDFTEAYNEINEMMNAEIIDVPLTPVKSDSKPSMWKKLVNWFKKK